MIEHTPTPWTYREDGDANHYAILTEDGKRWVISFLHNGEQMPEKQKANARFIVCAVNSHAALVEALQKIQPMIEHWASIPSMGAGGFPEIIRTALAQAQP